MAGAARALLRRRFGVWPLFEARNKVFAEVFGKDPEFFSFYRSMQAYEASIKPGDTRMVLTPDSPFFRYFNDPNAQRQDGQASAPATPAQPAPARP